MSRFLYGDSYVGFDGEIYGEYHFKPIIYISNVSNCVYIDYIFETWFERGLLRASLNEQVLFDLEFGDGEHFKLFSFVKMLEKREEK